MKQIKITTSRGEFIVLDVDYNAITFIRTLDTATAFLGSEELFDYKESFKLSKITEEEASEIVDEDNDYGVRIFQNYQTTSMQYFDEQITAIESLHSLLELKGIHLFENPYDEAWRQKAISGYPYSVEESKTFYNPYIFKL